MAEEPGRYAGADPARDAMTKAPIITVEQVLAAKFRFVHPLDTADDGHLLVYRCTNFPRLEIYKRDARSDTAPVAYVVDGEAMADITAAARALSVPPRPAPEMIWVRDAVLS